MAAVSSISRLESTNAETAARMPMPGVEAAIRAAPGVDQAATIGMRWPRLRISDEAAVARHMAAIHDVVSAVLAPIDCAAASTSGTEPPKPTVAATTADAMTEMRMDGDACGGMGRPLSTGTALFQAVMTD